MLARSCGGVFCGWLSPLLVGGGEVSYHGRKHSPGGQGGGQAGPHHSLLGCTPGPEDLPLATP